MPHADVHAVSMAHQLQKLHHVVVVVQRFTGTHQHDVGYPSAAVLLGKEDLIQNLCRGQIAALCRIVRCTEHAAHLAAGLGRHADAVAVLIFHQHGLNAVAVGQAKQILDGAVQLGHLLAQDLRLGDETLFVQFGTQRLGDVTHLVKRGDTLVQPFEDLLGTVFRFAHFCQKYFQLLGQQGLDRYFLFHISLAISEVSP